MWESGRRGGNRFSSGLVGLRSCISTQRERCQRRFFAIATFFQPIRHHSINSHFPRPSTLISASRVRYLDIACRTLSIAIALLI